MPNFDQITYEIQASSASAAACAQRAPRRPQHRLEGAFHALRRGLRRLSARHCALDATSDGVKHGHLEVILVAYDRDRKNYQPLQAHEPAGAGPPRTTRLQTKGLPVHHEIDVPPGDIYLRTGIYDLNSGNAGTIGIPVGTVNAAGNVTR